MASTGHLMPVRGGIVRYLVTGVRVALLTTLSGCVSGSLPVFSTPVVPDTADYTITDIHLIPPPAGSLGNRHLGGQQRAGNGGRILHAHQCHTATRHHTFFDGGTGSVAAPTLITATPHMSNSVGQNCKNDDRTASRLGL